MRSQSTRRRLRPILAFTDLSAALFVIVAIAEGLMVGVGLYERAARVLGRRVPEM